MRNKSVVYCTLLSGICLLAAQVCLLAFLLYPQNKRVEYSFDDIETLINVTLQTDLMIIGIDEQILKNLQSVNGGWKDKCIVCDKKDVVTFAILLTETSPHNDLPSIYRKSGFQVTVFQNINPLEKSPYMGDNINISYFLKRHIIVHLVLFHEREGNFWWYGDINSDPKANEKLSLYDLTLHDLSVMNYEGALEKFETNVVYLDRFPVFVPKNIPDFLRKLADSHFIECRHRSAKKFYQVHAKDTSQDARRFSHKAWKLLSKAKTLLDSIGVRFWLSSGTCLGYFRQCDIIPYSKDVDIGIFITDYNENIVAEFIAHGFKLKHLFGKVNDSLELSFLSGNIKLDIFFFYEENYWVWNGGTQAKSGKKFKYIFPRFTLCWTEFLELRVRIPCETEAYIEANYGAEWAIPITSWDWKSSPSNVKENGVWPIEEWSQVIQVFD